MASLLQIAGSKQMVLRLNGQALSFADMIAQVVRSLRIIRGFGRLSEVVVAGCERRIGDSEIWIEPDSLFELRNCRGEVAFPHLADPAAAERLQSIQGRSGDLIERGIKLFSCGNGFAQFFAHLAGG